MEYDLNKSGVNYQGGDDVTINTTNTGEFSNIKLRQTESHLTLIPIGEVAVEQNAKTVKTLTREDIKTQLTGYVTVDELLWPTITRGSHVRYIDTDRKYHTGGYIKFINPADQTFTLETSRFGKFSPKNNYHPWILQWHRVRALFKRISPAAKVEITLVRRELSQKDHEIMMLRKRIESIEQVKIMSNEDKIMELAKQLGKQKQLIRNLIDNQK